MALLGSLNKPLMSTRGPLGKIIDMSVKGMGGGVLANVIDKELLKGRAKAAGIALPMLSALGPTPVSANLTDAGMFLAVNGIKMPSKGSLITMAGLFFLKKLAEARGWIVDDPIGYNYSSTNKEMNQTEPMPMISSGGLTGR